LQSSPAILKRKPELRGLSFFPRSQTPIWERDCGRNSIAVVGDGYNVPDAVQAIELPGQVRAQMEFGHETFGPRSAINPLHSSIAESNIETLLLRDCRGRFIACLSGLHPKPQDAVVHAFPFLCALFATTAGVAAAPVSLAGMTLNPARATLFRCLSSKDADVNVGFPAHVSPRSQSITAWLS